MQKIRSDSTLKATFGQSHLLTVFYNQVSTRDLRYTYCRETFMTVPSVMYTRKNFYLYDSLNEKIEILRAAGLIDFWQFQYIDKRFIGVKESIHPRVMTMYQLLGCFGILCIGCGISFLIFVSEVWLSALSLKQTKGNVQAYE